MDHKCYGKKLNVEQKHIPFNSIRSVDKELSPLTNIFIYEPPSTRTHTASLFTRFMSETDYSSVDPIILWENINLEQPMKHKMPH